MTHFLFILCLNFQQFQNCFLRSGISTMYDGKCTFFKFIDKILGIDTLSKDYAKKQPTEILLFSKFLIEIEKYPSILNFTAGVSKPGQPRRTQDPKIGNPFS